VHALPATGHSFPRMRGLETVSAAIVCVSFTSSVEQRLDRVGRDLLMSANLTDLVGVLK